MVLACSHPYTRRQDLCAIFPVHKRLRAPSYRHSYMSASRCSTHALENSVPSFLLCVCRLALFKRWLAPPFSPHALLLILSPPVPSRTYCPFPARRNDLFQCAGNRQWAVGSGRSKRRINSWLAAAAPWQQPAPSPARPPPAHCRQRHAGPRPDPPSCVTSVSSRAGRVRKVLELPASLRGKRPQRMSCINLGLPGQNGPGPAHISATYILHR